MDAERSAAVVEAFAHDEIISAEAERERLDAVVAFFDREDPDRKILTGIMRRAIDDALDGSKTGRYDTHDLNKVEKTFVGMRVELGLSKTFGLSDGDEMDFSIAGFDVDCKFSFYSGGWQIPPEAVGQLCLVVWADDHQSRVKVGLVLIRKHRLNLGNNRDKKVTLNAQGRSAITWLLNDGELPPNVLLHLPVATRQAIWAAPQGQKRVDALFRYVPEQIIPRVAIETVARQTDPAKRARDARKPSHLGGRGFVILGGDFAEYRHVALALGLPVPAAGQWISARVVADVAELPGSVLVDGEWWRRAKDGEGGTRAPRLDVRVKH